MRKQSGKPLDRSLVTAIPAMCTALFAQHLNINNTFKTLPKALQTQALTALTSDFGLVGLVQYAW